MDGCLTGLALAYSKPSSCLKCLFHLLIYWPRHYQIWQHSLSSKSPSSLWWVFLWASHYQSLALACKITSKGLKFRFQFIGIVSQQSRLNEHSKKRWKNLFLHSLSRKLHNCSHPVPYFFLLTRDSLYSVYPWGVIKRKF